MRREKTKTVIVDGVRYVPEEKSSSVWNCSDTQGYTDRELINRSMFEADEHRDPVKEQKKYDEAHRVW